MKAPSSVIVLVSAPEQARFVLPTVLLEFPPSPMCTMADLERWQSGMSSLFPSGASKYAVGPRASMTSEFDDT